jgi:hypothetical protein
MGGLYPSVVDGGNMKTLSKLILGGLLIVLTLSGCRKDASNLANSSPAEQTAFAKTIAVMQTSVSNPTPTGQVDPSAGMTQTAQALLPGMPTSTPAPTTTIALPTSFIASGLTDLTIPDGTVLQPGEKFTKTWRISNGGTGTWTPDFLLIFFSGDDLGAPLSVRINQTVAPGKSVDISMDMVAPQADGAYTSYFFLQTNNGVNFGIGSAGKDPFWVYIKVQTPFDIMSASMSASPLSYSGTCPAIIMLHAKITTSSAGSVTFHFESASLTSSKETLAFKQAEMLISNGTPWTVNNTGDETISLFIDSPGNQVYDTITIPVTCTP